MRTPPGADHAFPSFAPKDANTNIFEQKELPRDPRDLCDALRVLLRVELGGSRAHPQPRGPAHDPKGASTA